MAIVKLTDDNFPKEVLESIKPVLVDFWAEWCAPCRVMGPIIEELGEKEEVKGKIKICKLNVDENPKTASQYSIMGIPTLILFDKGKEVKRMVGVRRKEEIIKEILNSKSEIPNKS